MSTILSQLAMIQFLVSRDSVHIFCEVQEPKRLLLGLDIIYLVRGPLHIGSISYCFP